jgi:hypothetical protein
VKIVATLHSISVICLLAVPAHASEVECISAVTKQDVCAIASMLAEARGTPLPYSFESGPEAGMMATATVAQGKSVIATIAHPLKLDALVRKLNDNGSSMRDFQKSLTEHTQGELCNVVLAAAFLNVGGQFMTVFVSSDNKVFAVSDATKCFGS